MRVCIDWLAKHRVATASDSGVEARVVGLDAPGSTGSLALAKVYLELIFRTRRPQTGLFLAVPREVMLNVAAAAAAAAECKLRKKEFCEATEVCTTMLRTLFPAKEDGRVPAVPALRTTQVLALGHQLLWLRGLSYLGRRNYSQAQEDLKVAHRLAPTPDRQRLVADCMESFERFCHAKIPATALELEGGSPLSSGDSLSSASLDELAACKKVPIRKRGTRPAAMPPPPARLPASGDQAAIVAASNVAGSTGTEAASMVDDADARALSEGEEVPLPPKKMCVRTHRARQRQQLSSTCPVSPLPVDTGSPDSGASTA